MSKLNNDWFHAFNGYFEDEEDIIEFIFERFNTKDFEDSYRDMGGYGEPNEMIKQSKENKRELFYDFLMELVEKANKNNLK